MPAASPSTTKPRPNHRDRHRRTSSHSSASTSTSVSSSSPSSSDSDVSDVDVDDVAGTGTAAGVAGDRQTSTGSSNVRRDKDQNKSKNKVKAKSGRRARRRSDDDEDDDDEDQGEEDDKEEITFEEFTATPAGPSMMKPTPDQERSLPGKQNKQKQKSQTQAPTQTQTPAPDRHPIATAPTSIPTTAHAGKKTREEKEAERKEKRRLKNKEKRRKIREGAGGLSTDHAGAKTTTTTMGDKQEDEDRERDEQQVGQTGEGSEPAGRAEEHEDVEENDRPTTQQDNTPKPPSNRQLYLSRLTSDPSFTPRVGTFWTHDERHYSKGKFGEDGEFAGLRGMSGWWRGGVERGGRGGRGRGFPVGRGGAMRGRGGMGARVDDRRAGTAEVETVAQSPDHQIGSTGSDNVPTSGPVPAAAVPRADASSSSWGHDAFEKMEQAEKKRSEAREKRRVQQALRGGAAAGAAGPGPAGFAGRGRGRGRGGAVGWGHGQPFGAPHYPGQVVFGQQQVPVDVQVNGGGFEDVLPVEDGKITVKLPKATSGINIPLAPPATDFHAEHVEPAHTVVDPNVVVVRLPAATTTHENAAPIPNSIPTLSTDHGEDSETVANLNLQAEIEYLKSQQATIAQKERQLDEELKRLEIGSRRVDSSAAVPISENGSMSSAPASSSYVPHNGMPYGMPPPPTFVPPGIAMAENGSFFEIATGQPVVFVASNSPAPPGNYPSGPFPPQPYYPNQHPAAGPYFRGGGYPAEQHPHLSRGDSFGTFTPPPYGRDSPLGYPAQSVPPGYFAPPRPAGKIQIRAPSSHEVAILKNPGKLGGDEHSHEPHMIPEGQAYSMDNPYAYQSQMMQPMAGQGYYPGMPMHQGYPPQVGYDYGYGQY